MNEIRKIEIKLANYKDKMYLLLLLSLSPPLNGPLWGISKQCNTYSVIHNVLVNSSTVKSWESHEIALLYLYSDVIEI